MNKYDTTKAGRSSSMADPTELETIFQSAKEKEQVLRLLVSMITSLRLENEVGHILQKRKLKYSPFNPPAAVNLKSANSGAEDSA